jgi:hypothetical protein
MSRQSVSYRVDDLGERRRADRDFRWNCEISAIQWRNLRGYSQRLSEVGALRKLSQVIGRHRNATGVLAIALLSLMLWLATYSYRRIVLPSIYGDVARIEIIDGGGMRTTADVAVLKTGVKAGDQTAANEIREAALAAFPSGSWQNVGPDAADRWLQT